MEADRGIRVSGRFWRGLAIGIPIGFLLWTLAFAALFGVARYGSARYQIVDIDGPRLLDTRTGDVFRPDPFSNDNTYLKSYYWTPSIKKD